MWLKENKLFLLILFIVIALRLIALDKGISGDEIYTLKTTDAKLSEIFSKVATRESHPPLSFYLLNIWRSIDKSETWTRMYFVLFGMAITVLLYAIGLECVDRKFALCAFFLSAISPLLIWSSHYIRSYGDSTFWVLLSTFFFVKILKAGNKPSYWIGYVLAATLSVYTFYFSWFFIITQFLYTLLKSKQENDYSKKILTAQAVVLLLFSPLVALLFKQMTSVATARELNWAHKGFQILGLRVGLYIRNVLALLGMDPYFLSQNANEILQNKFLILVVPLLILIFLLITTFGFHSLKKFTKNPGLFLFFLLCPAILAHTVGRFFNLLPNARYLVVSHVFFIYFMAATLYFFIRQEKKVASVVCVIIFLGLFSMRLPAAYTAEYETRKANFFIVQDATEKDCIAIIDKVYIGDCMDMDIVEVKSWLKRDQQSSHYLPLSKENEKRLKVAISKYENVYLYLFAGNTKIFGANDILKKWFENSGYTNIQEKNFKNIVVLKYKR